jgi:MFS family permease
MEEETAMENVTTARPPGATRRSHKTWTLVLASLGVFMTALDTLVVATALPVLRVDLHASLPDLEWTVNSYNLAFAWLAADRRGARRQVR